MALGTMLLGPYPHILGTRLKEGNMSPEDPHTLPDVPLDVRAPFIPLQIIRKVRS